MCTKLAHAHGLVPKDGLLQLLCEGFVARELSLCLLKNAAAKALSDADRGQGFHPHVCSSWCNGGILSVIVTDIHRETL